MPTLRQTRVDLASPLASDLAYTYIGRNKIRPSLCKQNSKQTSIGVTNQIILRAPIGDEFVLHIDLPGVKNGIQSTTG